MKAKKIFALALALVMLFSLAVPAFAEGEKQYRDYEYYMNIGDSIARACGLEFAKENGKEDLYGNHGWNNDFAEDAPGGHNYPGSFPNLVANAINSEKQYADGNFQFAGMRLVDAYYGLGMEIEPDEYLASEYFRRDAHLASRRTVFQERVKLADFITLQLGFNDVFYSAQMLSGLMDLDLTAIDPAAAGDALVSYIEWMEYGYARYIEYYPKMLERIFALQKKAGKDPAETDIVLVGVFSPISNCPITDEIFLPLGEALNIMADRVNYFLMNLADQYPNVYYVDISNVETPVSSGTTTFVDALSYIDGVYNPSRAGTINMHPTPEGYAYIARQILSVLPQEEVKYPDTFIRFNLPTSEQVISVKLGTRDAMFTQDGYELTVPNYSPFVSSMTVTGMTEDGKTVIYVYNLSYTPGEGYTANRITGTNDLTSSLTRAITGFISVIKTVITAIKGLFNS